METVACRAAIERLSAYLANPKRERAGVDAALSHIGDCSACMRRFGYLVRALSIDAIDRLGCQACQDRLPEYVAAAEAGQEGTARWHDVALHLALCPHCASAYADLSDLVALAQAERGVEPPTNSEPDLTFLDRLAAVSSRQAWHLDAIGRLVIEFSAELLRALQMPPQPAFAASGLKAGALPAPLRPFTLIDKLADQDVTIMIEPARDNPARCTLIVHVNIPSRGGWPNLGGTQVALRRGDVELAQTTDAFGNAVFERIMSDDLAGLIFIIQRESGE